MPSTVEESVRGAFIVEVCSRNNTVQKGRKRRRRSDPAGNGLNRASNGRQFAERQNDGSVVRDTAEGELQRAAKHLGLNARPVG